MVIHISLTQKWAVGYNPPLRSGERTERRYVYRWYGILGLIFNKHIGGCMLL